MLFNFSLLNHYLIINISFITTSFVFYCLVFFQSFHLLHFSSSILSFLFHFFYTINNVAFWKTFLPLFPRINSFERLFIKKYLPWYFLRRLVLSSRLPVTPIPLDFNSANSYSSVKLLISFTFYFYFSVRPKLLLIIKIIVWTFVSLSHI